MTNSEFDTLVDLIKCLSYRAAGNAIHQRRAGHEDENIEYARMMLVNEPPEGISF